MNYIVEKTDRYGQLLNWIQWSRVYENIELISLTIHLLFLKLEDDMGSFSFYWQRIKFAELENAE